jgi:N utilization substance protein A
MRDARFDDWTFIHKLFAEEVPEVSTGTVEIRAVARVPGVRTKVAVTSLDPEIDALAACVGQKGRHVDQISSRLKERIDMMHWSDHPETFVKWALCPAVVTSVVLEVERHRAIAHVKPDQLPAALGPRGENRELASRLTGWEVEVVAMDAA